MSNDTNSRESSNPRPMEQPAVRTTIVGGRPPGAGRGVGDIPRGMEVLLKKAAVDPEFRELLLEQRDKAAETIGLSLIPMEELMLRAIPHEQLAGMIDRTRVDPARRNAFLGKAAAVMLAALSATTLGCDKKTQTEGIRPDPVVSDKPAATQPAETTANQPATQPAKPETKPSEPVSRGIRPDRVDMTQGSRPYRTPMSKGIRPSEE